MARRAWGPAIQNPEEQFNLKRKVVLDFAAKTFSERGYDQTTLADIAEELHIAKPTLYNYFDSKDDILYEIQKTAIATVTEIDRGSEDDPQAPGLAPEQRLARFLTLYVRMITSDFGACISTAPVQAMKPETQAKLAESSRQVDLQLRDIIRDGVKTGVFAPCDPKITSAFIFGALNWIPRWRHREGSTSASLVEASLIEFVTRSLTNRAAGEPKAVKARTVKKAAS